MLMENVRRVTTQIDPDFAREMLTKNFCNRNVKELTVDLYARQMKNGKWVYNGDAIRMSVNGMLLDGQHRLLAIIKSETTQTMDVIYNLPDEIRDTIDCGANRSIGDMLSIDGVKNANVVAAMCGNLLRIADGSIVTSRKKYSCADIRSLYDRNENDVHRSIDFVHSHYQYGGGSPLSISMGATCHYEFSKIDPLAADDFMYRLMTGNEIHEHSPIGAVRNRLFGIKVGKLKITVSQTVAMVIRAWNLCRENKTVKSMKLPSLQALANNFPKVKG